jgi:hypothetical protein
VVKNDLKALKQAVHTIDLFLVRAENFVNNQFIPTFAPAGGGCTGLMSAGG